MIGNAAGAVERHKYSSRFIMLCASDDDGSRPITVHEDVLRQHSGFFRAALREWKEDSTGEIKRWKEGETGEIAMPTDNTKVLSCYAGWLYSENVDTVFSFKDPPDPGPPDYEYLVHLYVFGERIQDDVFCNAILSNMILEFDCIREGGGRYFPPKEAIEIAYRGTPPKSPMRKFLIEVWAYIPPEIWDSVSLGVPDEFMREMNCAIMEGRIIPPGHKTRAPSFQPRRMEWMKQK